MLKYAVFLITSIIVTFLHLYLSQNIFRKELGDFRIEKDFCQNIETKYYCMESKYLYFPFILEEKDNNIIFIYPDKKNIFRIIFKDGNYIKTYSFYFYLNFRYRIIDILLFILILFLALSFFEYTKLFFGNNGNKTLENLKK